MPLATQRGGAEKCLYRLLQCEPEPDVRWIVGFLEEGPLRQAAERHGIQTHVVNAGRLREVHKHPRTVRRIVTLARETNADVILSWMPKAHVYGAWAAKWAGLPAAWYQHGVPELGWLDQFITLHPTDSIITCSRHVADLQSNLWPHHRTDVVYPCVDLGRFDPNSLPSTREARRQLGLPTKGPLLGIVGRLQHWKGIHTFVDMIPLVQNTHPDAHGVIVGGTHPMEPEYDALIEQRISEKGLQASISKVGHQSNVPTWMQAMDVVIHASKSEPFGMVVIEAMTLGKPVVVGSSGGPREIITEGKNGLCAPFERPDVLADQLIRLLDHPEEARRMGRAARNRALDFSARDFSDRLTSTLRSLTRPSHS